MDFNEEYENLVASSYTSSTNVEETVETEGEYFLSDEDFIQKRLEDENDELTIVLFYEEDCCSLKCNTKISKEVALRERLNFMELIKEDQDLVICSHLELHRHQVSLKNEYKRSNTKESTDVQKGAIENRQRITYYFADLSICQKMYFFLHSLTIKRFKNIVKHFNENGVTKRHHKLIGKASTNKSTITPLDIEKIVTFIKNYANKVAIPLPGRMPHNRNFEKVVKLPSCDTKLIVYRKFVDAVKVDEEIRIVSQSSFLQIWNQYCPEIMTMKPASDLCDTCRQIHLKLAKMSQVSIEEQAIILEEARNHLNTAKIQREFYNSWREEAKNDESLLLMVASFDYAQNVTYPSSPQQVGSSYFKANRKCSVFGINNEKTHVQTNFLVDEKDSTGKGANATISMLHSYLTENNKCKKLVLFADNCVGQNKNNALLHYLLWRVITGKNETITLNFLLTGHTKFSPDRNFGILKSKYSKSVVDCQEDLIEVVKSSSPNNFNIAVPSVDPTSKIRNVDWSEWDAYLKQYFKSIPSLTKYHHFSFFPDGQIKAKLFSDSPEVVVHKEVDLNSTTVLPLKSIKPAGFSAQRSWYLYEDIRPLCFKESSKDLLAPKPKVPKPKKTKKYND